MGILFAKIKFLVRILWSAVTNEQLHKSQILYRGMLIPSNSRIPSVHICKLHCSNVVKFLVICLAIAAQKTLKFSVVLLTAWIILHHSICAIGKCDGKRNVLWRRSANDILNTNVNSTYGCGNIYWEILKSFIILREMQCATLIHFRLVLPSGSGVSNVI